MSDFKNSLAYLIANQVPDYIRDEFPQFVLFLEKYYAFLDQDGEVNNVLLNASSFSDINKTLDQFLPSFREQYLQMFPKDSLITDRRLIKFIREFYEAKGSEESIHFIFRTFFDEHVEIIYPSQYILKASDGIWVNKQKIRIITDDTITLDPFELEGKQAKIYSYKDIGNVSTYDVHSITVDTVTRLAYATQPTYELFVKHQENDNIILPGAGAYARALIVDGQIKAVTGDPFYHSRYFTTNIGESIDYDTDIITIPDHGFTTGDCVIYNTNEYEAVDGLLAYRHYFVKVIDQNKIRLYRDRISLQKSSYRKFVKSGNVDPVYNTIIVPNHGFITGDMVIYYADIQEIGGITNGNVYYIIKIDNNTIKLAESLIDSDPRYCSDDTYFAEDYVTITAYNEINLTSAGIGDYHVLSREYFINLMPPDTDSEQSLIDSMDARGTGYNAVPTVDFISEVGGTGATGKVYLNSSGGVDYVTIETNGQNYVSESTVVDFNTDSIRTFVYMDDIANKYGYITRTLSNVLILSISGTPNYGFKVGEVYKINEGGTAGQYVYTFPNTSLNYFAGDYVRINVENNASIIIEAVDANGKPTRARIFSPGGLFEQETFTATITSTTGSDCLLQFTTSAITTIQEGYQNRQGMLSDVNHLQDNFYYQNYSYVLRSKVPSDNWMTMVKNTVHPAGMAVFGELLLLDNLQMGTSFEIQRQPIDFYEFVTENLHAIESIGIDYDIAVELIKAIDEEILNANDVYESHFFKNVDAPEIVNIGDTSIIGTNKVLTETNSVSDSIPYMVFSKNINEVINVSDVINSIEPVFRVPNDDPIITDVSNTSFHKIVTDSVSVSDSMSPFTVTKQINETLPHGVNENLEMDIPGKAALDSTHTMEHTYSNVGKNLSDTTNTMESGVINIQDYWAYDYTSGAYATGDYVGSNNSI